MTQDKGLVQFSGPSNRETSSRKWNSAKEKYRNDSILYVTLVRFRQKCGDLFIDNFFDNGHIELREKSFPRILCKKGLYLRFTFFIIERQKTAQQRWRQRRRKRKRRRKLICYF